jgi:hypothetical protein
LNRQSFAEVMKYNIDGCNLQTTMKNNRFVKKLFTEAQKMSKMKISCPMKKVRIFDYGSQKLNLIFEYISGTVQDYKLVYHRRFLSKINAT